MYTCEWFILCENVVHNSQTNSLTLVNVLKEMTTTAFPSLHARFSFAAVVKREGEEEGPLSLRFVRETEAGDEIVVNAPGTESPERAQFFVNFPAGVRLYSEGPVSFRIDVREGEGDWYVVSSQEIVAQKVDSPAG